MNAMNKLLNRVQWKMLNQIGFSSVHTIIKFVSERVGFSWILYSCVDLCAYKCWFCLFTVHCSYSVSLPPMFCDSKLVCANCELSLGLLHRKMCQRIVEFVPFPFAILRCVSLLLNEISLVLPLSFVVWLHCAFALDAALNHNFSLVYLTRAMDFGSIVNSDSRLLL